MEEIIQCPISKEIFFDNDWISWYQLSRLGLQFNGNIVCKIHQYQICIKKYKPIIAVLNIEST
jgi:hypothetical protein